MSTDTAALCVHLLEVTSASPRRGIDWNAVERDYRESSLSLRELACRHGCSHSAIANRANRLQWTRALPAQPKAAVPGRTGQPCAWAFGITLP